MSLVQIVCTDALCLNVLDAVNANCAAVNEALEIHQNEPVGTCQDATHSHALNPQIYAFGEKDLDWEYALDEPSTAFRSWDLTFNCAVTVMGWWQVDFAYSGVGGNFSFAALFVDGSLPEDSFQTLTPITLPAVRTLDSVMYGTPWLIDLSAGIHHFSVHLWLAFHPTGADKVLMYGYAIYALAFMQAAHTPVLTP